MNQEAFTRAAIDECHQYFTDLGLAERAKEKPDPTIQDTDGLVSYVNASTNQPPQKLMDEWRKISAILEGFTGIVVAAVLELAGGDTAKKHDPATWNGPLNAIVKAFFGPYKDDAQKLDKEVVGVEVATQFIEILLAAAVTGGAGALPAFEKFLQSQGESMRIEAGGSGAHYKYACIGMAHELFEIEPGNWLYVPKLKYYFTQFDQETWKVTSGCVSAQHFKFHFELRNLAAAFRLEYWRQNDWFKKEVDDFIAKYTKANIKDSTNYFDGVFDSKPDESNLLDLRLSALEDRALRDRLATSAAAA